MSGMTQDELMSLLYTVASHARSAISLTGCAGGAAYKRRSGTPKVGDLVLLLGSLGPDWTNIGWLRGIEEGEHKYAHIYTIEHLNGETLRWVNVLLQGAVPAGNVYGALMKDPDEVFRPQPANPERTRR